MVGSIGSTSNIVNMISLTYQQGGASARQVGTAASPSPPPPPPSGTGDSSTEDPLGVFSSVDSDSDGSISIDEYDILTEGILEVTGNALASSFLDYDEDGDGKLNPSELRSVLDEAGFAPPQPPPREMAAAYEAQSGETSYYQTDDESLLAQLLAYLETWSDNFDIIV